MNRTVITGSLLAAGLIAPSGAAARDQFRPALGENRAAIVKISKAEGLKGGYSYLTSRVSGTTFGVACGRSGGEYGGFVPLRKRYGRWRTYEPSTGGLMTFALACDKRRP